MKRRKFLVGLGSTAAAGSALIGSGAFSQVESHRDVTIEVAEDPNAYLAMDDCMDSGGNVTPNSSFADLDGDGHLEVDMGPSGNGGTGVNSDSISWFDNVFQICNHGKECAGLWIEKKEKQGEDPGRVTFYVDGQNEPPERFVSDPLADREKVENDSGIREVPENEGDAIRLTLGECVCVGIQTYTKEDDSFNIANPSADDTLLSEVRINADVESCPDLTTEFPDCPFYGTTQTSGETSEIVELERNNGGITESTLATIPDDSTNVNYPNGLAYDAEDTWYYAEEDGDLLSQEAGGGSVTNYGSITSNETPVAGAAYWDKIDETDEYLYIPQGTDQLKAADISGNSATTRDVATIPYEISLGDLAVDHNPVGNDILYISGNAVGSDEVFIEVNLNTPSDKTVIANETDNSEFAVLHQLAFVNNTLYSHNANTGTWYTVDTGTGEVSDPIDTTDTTYTDLARCAIEPVEQ